MYKYISPSIWPLVTFLTSYPPPPTTNRQVGMGVRIMNVLYCSAVQVCLYKVFFYSYTVPNVNFGSGGGRGRGLSLGEDYFINLVFL